MTYTNDNLSHKILASPILIVDDSIVNRMFLEKILRTRGFTRLMSADSAEDAAVKIKEFQPEILLLDVMMPGGIDGFEYCELLRKQDCYRDLPILIQTALTEGELRAKAFKMGATDFVSKPIYPDELCARITVHLEKKHSLQTLQIYKERMTAEMESATQLQMAILPGADEIMAIRARCQLDVAAYFEPSSEIGGDFWGMKNIFPHQTAFWLVDFAGHGMASALNAFRLQAYLKDPSALAARPGEYLAHLNDKLLHLLLRGQFATMFYGIVDTQSNMLFYACASVPHPIILRRATGRAVKIDGSGRPLGIGMHLYATQTVPFLAGDTLVLYSDAFIETPDANNMFISEDQLVQLIEKNAGLPAEQLKEKMLLYFKEHAGEKLRDDLTLTICTRSAL